MYICPEAGQIEIDILLYLQVYINAILVSLRFDTAGDYGYVGSKYTSNAHVLRGNHLQAHVAVRELTTKIGIASRTHHYAAILRFVLLILSSL